VLVPGGKYFFGSLGRNYDVSRDGQRFLLMKDARAPGPNQVANVPGSVLLVQHWLDEVRRLAPAQ
jgi:hypothetical protein